MIPRLLAFVAALFAATAAYAQADVFPDPVARKGDYRLHVQAPSDADLALVCCDRVEGAAGAWILREQLACVPAPPGAVLEVPVTVKITPKDDAEVRCFAYDGLDPFLANESSPSPNAAFLDFTPPGRAEVLP